MISHITDGDFTDGNSEKTSKKAVEIVEEADERVGLKKMPNKKAGEEIERKIAAIGLWAKTIAKADGDEKKQKALYLKYRAEQLMNNETSDG